MTDLNKKLLISTTSLQDYLATLVAGANPVGTPLAAGIIRFYKNGTLTPKTVYAQTNTDRFDPNYPFAALPNPVYTSPAGVPTDNQGNNVQIYYYPWDDQNTIEQYTVIITDSNGIPQATINNWPPLSAISSESQVFQAFLVTTPTQELNNLSYYICGAGATQIEFQTPLTPNLGDMYTIEGTAASTGGWKVTVQSGQQIYLGNKSTTVTTGILESTDPTNSLTLVCIAANKWIVNNPQGNILIT